MKGDSIVIEEHHRKAAAQIVDEIAGQVESVAGSRGGGEGDGSITRRFVITVAGESGSGKSETGTAIAEELTRRGHPAVVLGQDDYFVLPPHPNDVRRREDPTWLGPHAEVRFDLLQRNVDDAAGGAETITKPLIDYDADVPGEETLQLEGARAVVVEGTYTSLLRNVDTRVFIARSRLDTLEHRKKRHRGEEADDPFVEGILETEHKIIAGHRQLADFVITKEYAVETVDVREHRGN